MSNPHIKEAYMCGNCGEIYNDEDSAYECCAPYVVEVYLCPTCGDDHREEDDAIACCDFDPEAPPPPLTAAELEAAGQSRLF